MKKGMSLHDRLLDLGYGYGLKGIEEILVD